MNKKYGIIAFLTILAGGVITSASLVSVLQKAHVMLGDISKISLADFWIVIAFATMVFYFKKRIDTTETNIATRLDTIERKTEKEQSEKMDHLNKEIQRIFTKRLDEKLELMEVRNQNLSTVLAIVQKDIEFIKECLYKKV